MNSLNGVPNKLSPDEIFEQAVARLEAGEKIESIIASYSLTDGEELRDFLTIVQATQPIRSGPIPQPPPVRRRQAKQNFLAAAASLRAQNAAAVAPAATSAQATLAVSTPVEANTKTATVRGSTVRANEERAAKPASVKRAQPSRKTARHTGTWLDQLSQTLQSIFTVRTLRLAPLILAVAVILLSTTTLVTVAQTAVPGDLTYSLKQWIRKQELELAPADQRALVRQIQEMELAEDVRRAALRADTNATVIQAEDTQVFYGRTGRVLRIGGLTVLDRYQPDANQEAFQAMTLEGDLLPGSLVRLSYQIMPGQSETVQGISLTVVSTPDEANAPGVAESADDAAPPVPAAATCTAELPADWITYQVRAGDNLTFIANRGGISVAELMEKNCLGNETILIGATLFVPGHTAQPGAQVCPAQAPDGWVEYEVRVGDNLSQLALRTGTTVDQIKEVNCLTSDTILIGAILMVPEASPTGR